MGVIPRTAGTSFGGARRRRRDSGGCGRYLNRILALDAGAGWVRVEPGVIRDQLNAELRPRGWWFGPNTSTASRCMLGGMVGNNSSGSTSIKYGVTRDKVLEIEAVLSDGSRAVFGAVSAEEFHRRRQADTLEGRIYQGLWAELSKPEQQEAIRRNTPSRASTAGIRATP